MDGDETRAFFARLPRAMVQNAMRILDHKGDGEPIRMVDAQHFEVVSLRTPSRRVGVHRRGDVWRCKSDKRNTSDNPCSHILAVMIATGEVERPNSAASVWMKGQAGRRHDLEEEAWRRIPTRVPEMLAELLRDGLPAIVDLEAVDGHHSMGRLRKPLYAQCYQAVVRTLERTNLRGAQGRMDTATHRAHNPYGGVSRSTMSRFHIDHGSALTMEKLLALSTWPARPYETLAHPDGTGLTEQHFSAYFDERYEKQERKRKEAEAEARAVAKEQGRAFVPQKPRKHVWTYAVILWTYRYTMIASLRTQQGPFGEAPWLIPLLERAKLMLNLEEVGGDKAYNAYYLDEYLARHDMDAQFKVKRNANPTRSYASKKAYKRRVEESRLDPEGFAAKANRRNNAETGNHAFKAILGDQIYSKDPLAQQVEILCMAIAYNLMRLVYLEVEQGIQVSFAGGAQVLREQPWQHLIDLYDAFKGRATPKPGALPAGGSSAPPAPAAPVRPLPGTAPKAGAVPPASAPATGAPPPAPGRDAFRDG
ncbi:MAG: hypothetical protein QOG31_1078 [Thermoplasmata archaeon]|jgi:hypothetical protein|nr:hypothetical protein [Thermoplasmata archaeon]